MKTITIRVPATTANLGPGFDSFGCALNLYNDVTFTQTDAGLRITGCDTAYAGEDNLVFQAYKAVLDTIGAPFTGLHIHIDANIPISRGLGSSAALLIAGAVGANCLQGSPLSREELLSITTRIEGHPDNLAPALYGGLTASMMEAGKPVTASFTLHPGWHFLALIPDFTLSTSLARKALPETYSRADAVYNISHGALTLKALEMGDETLLRLALQDRLHQDYRCELIQDYDAIKSLALQYGAFCISGAGPTLLCITSNAEAGHRLAAQLPRAWRLLALQAEDRGAMVLL